MLDHISIRLRLVLRTILLASLYVLFGKLGLIGPIEEADGNVTLIWPPSGIAFAAAIYLGYKDWPGLAIGALTLNLINGSSVAFAIITAVGNPLPAIAAFYILRRYTTFDPSFGRLTDALWFLFIPALLTPILSASLGGMGLVLFDDVPLALGPNILLSWWVGDAMGVLLIAPVIFTIKGWVSETWNIERVAEIIPLILGLLFVGTIFLTGSFGYNSEASVAVDDAFLYSIFVLAVWSAIRFGPHGTSVSIFIIAMFSFVGSVIGHGPFASDNVQLTLIKMHMFLAALAIVSMCLAAEVEEYKRSRRSLQESETRFRALLDNSPTRIISKDLEERYQVTNKAFTHAFDKSEDQIIGKRSRDLPWLTQEEIDANERGDKEVLENGVSVTYESIANKGTISESHWEVVKYPILNESQEIIGLGGIGTNITQRKIAEQASQESMKAAEDANRAKSTFLAAASHDVRQPLQALEMFQSVLKDRISSTPAGQDETVQSLFERMNDCFLALKGLFDSLLDISKLDSQTMKPNITEFSLLNLMSRILSRYDGLAQVKELEFKIYAPDFKVLCDETLLSQILSNFVGNAIRYTESGKVQFRAYQRANQICIEVQDTGVGIPPDKIKYIFDEFYQVGNEQRDRTQGLGLGLSIAKKRLTFLDCPYLSRLKLDLEPHFQFGWPM